MTLDCFNDNQLYYKTLSNKTYYKDYNIYIDTLLQKNRKKKRLSIFV